MILTNVRMRHFHDLVGSCLKSLSGMRLCFLGSEYFGMCLSRTEGIRQCSNGAEANNDMIFDDAAFQLREPAHFVSKGEWRVHHEVSPVCSSYCYPRYHLALHVRLSREP